MLHRHCHPRKLTALLAFIFIGWIIAQASTASAAVTVTSFSAQAGNNQIKLLWTTASELKNRGFNVERSTNQSNWQRLGSTPSVLSKSPCISSFMGASYEFVDTAVTPGQKYYYRLQLYGQPCGDTNTYHEEIVSAVVDGPTATPTATATRTATRNTTASSTTIATATTTAVASFTPSATIGFTPNANPSRTLTRLIASTQTPSVPATLTPKMAVAVPTKIAASQVQPTLAPTPQAMLNSSTQTNEQTATVDEPVAEPEDSSTPTMQPSIWEEVARIGVIGLAGLLGFSSLGCAALALYLYARPHRRR